MENARDLLHARLGPLGIKGVLLDLENTLVPYGAAHLPVQARELLVYLQEAGLPVMIASNARGSPIAEELRAAGISYQFGCWKPFPLRLKSWRQSRNLRGGDILVVGDQVLTDGLLAVFIRSHLLLVSPVSSREPIWARMQRLIGRLIKPLLFGGMIEWA